MGALPKRKLSGRRRGNRRSHDRAAALHLVRCEHCRAFHPSHHACPNCGYYNGRTAIAVPSAATPGTNG